MADDTVPSLLTVLAGSFEHQAGAFEALRQDAEAMDVVVTLDDVDVIREASEVRLAYYFRPALVARIEKDRADDDTVVLLFPSPLTARPGFPPEGSRLRLLGRYSGRVKTRPL